MGCVSSKATPRPRRFCDAHRAVRNTEVTTQVPATQHATPVNVEETVLQNDLPSSEDVSSCVTSESSGSDQQRASPVTASILLQALPRLPSALKATSTPCTPPAHRSDPLRQRLISFSAVHRYSDASLVGEITDADGTRWNADTTRASRDAHHRSVLKEARDTVSLKSPHPVGRNQSGRPRPLSPMSLSDSVETPDEAAISDASWIGQGRPPQHPNGHGIVLDELSPRAWRAFVADEDGDALMKLDRSSSPDSQCSHVSVPEGLITFVRARSAPKSFFQPPAFDFAARQAPARSPTSCAMEALCGSQPNDPLHDNTGPTGVPHPSDLSLSVPSISI